jgi:hypothetical protein
MESFQRSTNTRPQFAKRASCALRTQIKVPTQLTKGIKKG